MTTETMVSVRDEANALAAEYLRRFWGDAIPVDPVPIATLLGVRVKQTDLPPDVAAAISKTRNDDPVLIVEERDHPHRQRFSVAHGLGHYARRIGEGAEVIDFLDRRDAHATQATDDEELFANEFAASLLMPEGAVRRLLGEHRRPDGRPDALLLASAFRVSEDAMRYRLRSLGWT